MTKDKNWRVFMIGLGVYRVGDSNSQTWHPVTKIFKTKQEAQEWLSNNCE